jgi:serine/threonine protein kinase
LSGHPNVLTVYTAGLSAEGHPYLVTEYLDRGSLADVIPAEGALAPSTVARIGAANEMGRCLTAKYEHNQDAATIADLRNNRAWPSQLSSGTTKLGGSTPGATACSSKSPHHAVAHVKVLKNSTGTTALPRSACFWQMS